jgi:hypothetical protein
MLTTAYFDHFSFGLCINVSAAARLSLPEQLLTLAAGTSTEDLFRSVRYIARLDDDERVSGALFLSNIWHENRHFSDLMLTNFGAYRVRLNFQSMYAAPAVLTEARLEGKLVIPVTAYADEIRLQSLGVEFPYPLALKAMAENLVRQFSFFESDKLNVHDRTLNSSSCYEALAYISQMAATEFYFGKEMACSVRRRLAQVGVPVIYSWLARFGRGLGLVESHGSGTEEPAIKAHLAAPLLFAALCGRAGSLSGEREGCMLPAHRLAALVAHIQQEGWTFHGMDGAAAWEAVDKAHSRLWGVRCIEEMLLDQQRNHELLQIFSAYGGKGQTLVKAFSEYVALRERMLRDFQDNPHHFVDPSVYPFKLLPHLHPMICLQNERGQFYPVPDGWERIWSGALPGSDAEQTGYIPAHFSRWWWCIARSSQKKGSRSYGLSHPAWYEVMSFWSPAAKFILAGRNASDCLGPELRLIENAFRRSIQNLIMDPSVCQPPKIDHVAIYRAMFGREPAICDFSGEWIFEDNSLFVSPWTLHSNEHNLNFVLQLYGSDNPLGPALLHKDWSMWLVHRRFADVLES